MGQHWSHLTPTKRIQLDAFIRAGMKPTDIAKDTTPKAHRPAMRPTSAPRGRS